MGGDGSCDGPKEPRGTAAGCAPERPQAGRMRSRPAAFGLPADVCRPDAALSGTEALDFNDGDAAVRTILSELRLGG